MPNLSICDDAKGRKLAKGVGIPVVGVAGVLLASKNAGQFSAVSPMIGDLVDIGYRLSAGLIDAVRRSANE